MRPVRHDFRTPEGGTPLMGVILFVRDPRTMAVARLPVPGVTIEWRVVWPDGENTIDQFHGLQVDRRSGAILYPLDEDRIAQVDQATEPFPYTISLRTSDGRRYPFLTGTVGIGDPIPMSSSPVLSDALAVPSIDAIPRPEPYLAGVILTYPLGAADEAEAAAAEMVARLLSRPNLGAALAETPDAADDSPRVATAAMVQAVAREIVGEAQKLAEKAVLDLIRTPNRLRDLIAANPTDVANLPVLNGDSIAFSKDA